MADRLVTVCAMTDAIVAEAVVKTYGSVRALDGLDLRVPEGTVLGLLGPNGAGKTTLLHMMAGFLAPSRGTVTVDGAPVWRHPAIYRTLGLITEREAVPGFLTGAEFVLSSARLHKLPDPQAAARRA